MIERLSKYIKILVLVIVGILSISTYILYQNNKSLESQLDISKSNEKAFAANAVSPVRSSEEGYYCI